MKHRALLPLLLLGLSSCASTPILSSTPSSQQTTSESLSSQSVPSSEPSSSASTVASSSSVVPSSSSESVSSASSSSSKTIEYGNPAGDPYLARQFYLNHIGNIYQAWESYRGDGITIAVIDVGFNPNHEDFLFADGTSKVSPLSASFTTTGSQTATDVGIDKVVNMGESHGTFCAGVAAAAINGKGVVGIAPNAGLLLLKTDCKPKSIAKAFHYAADNGAKVVTISIGSYYDYVGDLKDDGSDLSKVFNEPVSYCRSKGTVVVSAAGNGGQDGHPTEYTFPGATTGVIGVGGLAANSQDQVWEGSSYNSSPQYRFADVFAPAEGMFGCCHYDGKLYDGYGWMGTSFASPQVAGMAALYFQKNPSATVDQFESALYASCAPMDPTHCGAGRVDVGKLLGLTDQGTFAVTVQGNWNSCYVYAWNLSTEKEIAPWPGVTMSKNGSTFTTPLDSGIYEHVIFSNGSNQTVDIALSSFRFGKAYSLKQTTSFGDKLIGAYA